MSEAFLVGREAEHPLERETGPSRVALGGHEEEIPARLEHAHHLGEEGLVVLDVLEEVDRRHHVEGRRGERQLAVPDLQHPVPDQLPGGPHVVALEVRAHPGPSALPQEVRGEPGAAAQLQAELPLHRGRWPSMASTVWLLLERPAEQL